MEDGLGERRGWMGRGSGRRGGVKLRVSVVDKEEMDGEMEER